MIALNLPAQKLKGGIQPFISPVNMVESMYMSGSPGGQSCRDQGRTCPKVGRFHDRSAQIRHSPDFHLVVTGGEIRPHSDQLMDMFQAPVKDLLGQLLFPWVRDNKTTIWGCISVGNPG